MHRRIHQFILRGVDLKIIARIILVLLSVNGLLVYMHYYQSAGANSEETKASTYSQEIEVINRSDVLVVRHNFSGLSNKRHEIIWPEESVNRTCYLSDAISCNRLDENTTAFLEGENDRQSISYEIPKKGQMKKNALFKEPFTALYGSSVSFTLFHMTDETGIGGLWVNGLERVGTKEMTSIDYALYRGSGGVTDLYWQKNSLPLLYAGDRLSVLGKGVDVKMLGDVDLALKSIDADHSTVVIDNTNPTVHSARFVISENTDAEKVSDRFLTAAMYNRFIFPDKEQLTAELAASILSGKVAGSITSRKLYQTLSESMSAEELETFKMLLKDMVGQEIDATVLDRLAGKVTGFKISYFKRNIEESVSSYPFLVEDSRKIHFEGSAFSDIQIILKDEKTFYPAKKILSLAGYKVTSNDRSIYIESEIRKFRFPKNDLFYVYNEHKYDLVTMPFEVLEDDFYFEENWFKRLFLLSIEKTADTIDITRISTLLEEEDN